MSKANGGLRHAHRTGLMPQGGMWSIASPGASLPSLRCRTSRGPSERLLAVAKRRHNISAVSHGHALFFTQFFKTLINPANWYGVHTSLNEWNFRRKFFDILIPYLL